jgi:hypothetical protein
MFRQIAPHGIVNKQAVNHKVPIDPMEEQVDGSSTLREDTTSTKLEGNGDIRSPTALPTSQMVTSTEDGLVSDIGTDFNKYDKEEDPSMTAVEESGLGDDGGIGGEGGSIDEPKAMPAPTEHTVDSTVTVTKQSSPDDAVTGVDIESLKPKSDHPSNAHAISIEDQAPHPEVPHAISSSIEETGPEKSVVVPDAGIDTEEAAIPVPYPYPHATEEAVQPQPGEAVAVGPTSEETVLTHKEMSEITAVECPYLMNKE